MSTTTTRNADIRRHLTLITHMLDALDELGIEATVAIADRTDASLHVEGDVMAAAHAVLESIRVVRVLTGEPLLAVVDGELDGVETRVVGRACGAPFAGVQCHRAPGHDGQHQGGTLHALASWGDDADREQVSA